VPVLIVRARNAAEIEVLRELFREYGRTPGVGECVVGFEQEVAGLPGLYDALLLGLVDGAPVGCVALRPHEAGVCEMKRLYVRDTARSTGVGRKLAEAAIGEARQRGYRRMRLDSLPSMTAAQRLYRSLGFNEIGPYYEGAPPDARFFELRLDLRPVEPAAGGGD
jgi:putative acetyltransferase